MPGNIREQFSGLLQSLADGLDISTTLYEETERRYKAVGEWLGKDDSPLAVYDPDIYPQGSFRLGTVVKPITDEDDYDIDLVLELHASKDNITQKELKQMVGDRLKANGTYAKMIEREGNRCWTLKYTDSAQFHMDILPAVPDDEVFKARLLQLGIPASWVRTTVCLTDKTWWNFQQYDRAWPRGNPKGYAEWFKEQMKVRMDEQKKAVMLKRALASIEQVPDYQVKTPLQRSVQLLKRHRDIMFEKDLDNRPISIIITTLAAHAYNNESDLLEALVNITDGMSRHIESRSDGTWVVNPVNPMENFAEKWLRHPEREATCRQWLEKVRTDLSEVLRKSELIEAETTIKASFGENAANTALRAVGGIGAAYIALKEEAPRIEIKNPSKPWGYHV